MKFSHTSALLLVWLPALVVLTAMEYRRVDKYIPIMANVENGTARTTSDCMHLCISDDLCFGVGVLRVTGIAVKIQCNLRLYPFPKHSSLPNTMRKSINGMFKKSNTGFNVPLFSDRIPSQEFPAGTIFVPKRCEDQALMGASKSQTYVIHVLSRDIRVFCEFDEDGTVWTYIQHRFDGSVDFYRNWDEYKNGFGNADHEFWLGNDVIHELTKSGDQSIRFVLSTDTETRHADYETFQVGNEADLYRLSIAGYSGTAGESMFRRSKGHSFSTFDCDHDLKGSGSCAVAYHGAWWYGAPCHFSNLNGLYLRGATDEFAKGVVWFEWKGYYYSLFGSTMKIKTKA